MYYLVTLSNSLSSMFSNQSITDAVFLHWLSDVLLLISVSTLSSIFLLTQPISLFDRLINLHVGLFPQPKLQKSIELSKLIWKLKFKKKDFDIRWSIITSASLYNNSSKRCNLCLTENLCIIKANKFTLLN